MPHKIAVEAIVNRAINGQIRVCALTSKHKRPQRPEQSIGASLLDERLLRLGEMALHRPQLWATGDLNFSYTDASAGLVSALASAKADVALFDVRFDPAGVRKLARPDTSVPQPVVATAALQPPEPMDSRKRVSDTHLKIWYDAYQQVYSGDLDIEDTAVKSAQGMFPDKFVSRDRVRALRGARKRGRRTSDKPD